MNYSYKKTLRHLLLLALMIGSALSIKSQCSSINSSTIDNVNADFTCSNGQTTYTVTITVSIAEGGNASAKLTYISGGVTQTQVWSDATQLNGTTFTYTADCGEAVILTTHASSNGNGSSCTTTTESEVPFPVELIELKAEVSGRNNTIYWKTATETNNSYFEIQRSPDGVRFETIGKIAGNHTTTEVHQYEFKDTAPLYTSYYRLKQVDIDGAYELTQIIELRRERKWQVYRPYPNPSYGDVTISFLLDRNKDINLTLVNMLGRSILTQNISGRMGVNTAFLNLDALDKGTYIVVLDDGHHSTVQKIVKL